MNEGGIEKKPVENVDSRRAFLTRLGAAVLATGSVGVLVEKMKSDQEAQAKADEALRAAGGDDYGEVDWTDYSWSENHVDSHYPIPEESENDTDPLKGTK